MSESHVLRAVLEYLQWGQNQGKWFYMRCNSGVVFPTNRDSSTRRVKLAPEGTADVLVIRYLRIGPDALGKVYPLVDILWIETKHKGKQSEAQKAFETQVRAQGCDYIVVRDVDELRERLEG